MHYKNIFENSLPPLNNWWFSNGTAIEENGWEQLFVPRFLYGYFLTMKGHPENIKAGFCIIIHLFNMFCVFQDPINIIIRFNSFFGAWTY